MVKDVWKAAFGELFVETGLLDASKYEIWGASIAEVLLSSLFRKRDSDIDVEDFVETRRCVSRCRC
jgi:hypothetical protein